MGAPACPLCEAPVDDDGILSAHLAASHGLVDDPGATTTLRDVGFVPPRERTPTAPTPSLEPPSLRVYDPRADDERWRPIVLGVGGLLVLVVAFVAVSFSG